MITLKDVLEWMKTLDTKFEHYYMGTLDSKKEHSLGIYNLKRSNKPMIALGGLECTKTSVKQVSLLIHWDKTSDSTEERAIKLYEELLTSHSEKIGEHKVYFVGMLTNEPIDVGRDEQGICEYVIEFEIYFKKEKEA